MRYVTRNVFIVKYADGAIAKVFGSQRAADEYLHEATGGSMRGGFVVDEWPVEFEENERPVE